MRAGPVYSGLTGAALAVPFWPTDSDHTGKGPPGPLPGTHAARPGATLDAFRAHAPTHVRPGGRGCP